MFLTVEQVIELGVSRSVIYRKVAAGEWASREVGTGRNGKPTRALLLASLPEEMQRRWLELNPRGGDPAPPPEKFTEVPANSHAAAHESTLTAALARLPLDERQSWIAEANRLRLLVKRYAALEPKRRRNPATGKSEFVPAVIALCEEAACADPVILAREPHRSGPPSPSTMDGWLRDYREIGLLAFIRTLKQSGAVGKDKRLAKISPAAVDWINANWRKHSGPRSLYKALSKEAEKEGWRIPSESWLDRRWREAPTIVKTSLQAGRAAYESKHAPYVPRDFSDLEALQILCGDHSERDVTVLLKDGSLTRPWLTLWQDLRTGLIWGWHLDLVPSSQTSALAYANGVETFGAQPPPRPEEQFHSYVYTDQGRDYRSHRWDGKVIAVHQAAMRVDGGLEFLCVQRKVGILEDMAVKHLLARGYNAKEKPVERTHRDLSDWEQNTFAEFCGRNPTNRPERWKKLYQEHQRPPANRKMTASPFIKFDDYRAQLLAFLTNYNSTEHERTVLGGVRVVPLEEYKRLYTTRYEIAPELLALLLMKPERRTVRKNDVQCFQKNWFYWHESLSEYKGMDVEVRYSEEDYQRVWVILPDRQVCEAELITPTSLLKPNKRTLQAVAETRAKERRIIREYHLLAESGLRGESTEDRVAVALNQERDALIRLVGACEEGEARMNTNPTSHVDGVDSQSPVQAEITASDIARIKADYSIFDVAPLPGRVVEFGYEENSSRPEEGEESGI
jgi:hypothetical protein